MLFYVSYDCNRANVWYECSLAVIKKKKEGDKWVNTNEKELIVNAYKILN